jgi:hypothetical protein
MPPTAWSVPSCFCTCYLINRSEYCSSQLPAYPHCFYKRHKYPLCTGNVVLFCHWYHDITAGTSNKLWHSSWKLSYHVFKEWQTMRNPVTSQDCSIIFAHLSNSCGTVVLYLHISLTAMVLQPFTYTSL